MGQFDAGSVRTYGKERSEGAHIRTRIYDQASIRRPDWIECLPGDQANWRSALQRNLEKPGTGGVAATSDDPSAIRRPATGALGDNSLRDGLEFGAVCREDMELAFPAPRSEERRVGQERR